MAGDLLEALAGSPLCAGLDELELRRVAAAGRVERWPEGAVVMEEGDSGPRLVVLLTGRVQVCKLDASGAEHLLAEIGPGGVLGEMSLLTHRHRTATVRAREPLRVFAMDRVTFDEMCADGDPAALKLGLSIARVLADRLERLNERLVELIEAEDPSPPLEQFARFRHELFSRWGS